MLEVYCCVSRLLAMCALSTGLTSIGFNAKRQRCLNIYWNIIRAIKTVLNSRKPVAKETKKFI